MPTFTSRSPVSAVVATAEGLALLEREAPELMSSPVLVNLSEFPVKAILKLVLGDTDPRPERIAAEIALIDDPRPVLAEEPRILPNFGYESRDVPEASARTTWPSEVSLNRRAEVVFSGPSQGNPFVDVSLTASFTDGTSVIGVGGFYDGDGRYVVRFLAPATGAWHFRTSSSARSLNGIEGTIDVVESAIASPVRAVGTHFERADGEPFRPVGTTAYAWTHQSEELQDRTIRSLADAPFNKLRMGLFPKHFLYNSNDPDRFVWERDELGDFDTTRFDVEYWTKLEARIDQLAEIGVEADIILFHPYDRWGFATQSRAADDRYVQYAVRRLSAFTNIWWSMANEYDLLLTKTNDDWDRLARIVRDEDPVGHPLSIHNWVELWDYSSDWATHCSIQRGEGLSRSVDEWRAKWNKPVIVDEYGYEGDIDQGWGNLTGEEFVSRAWQIAIRGGYGSHGETFHRTDEELWWSKGGELHGSSAPRLKFLDSLISESPTGRLDPLPSDWDVSWGGAAGSYVLLYFGGARPSFRDVAIPEGMTVEIDVIDTWAMTVDRQPGEHSGSVRVNLPARPYCAIRLRSVG